MSIEKEELSELMDTHGNYLKTTAFHIIHDIQLAEDMVQETFISYYRKRQFKGNSSVKTYLYRILMNHIKMYHRKNKLRTLPEEMIYTSLETVEIETGVVNKMDLSYAINSLPHKYNEILVLYYYNDLSIEDLSSILNCSKSSVKMRLKRGREHLKNRLGESYE